MDRDLILRVPVCLLAYLFVCSRGCVSWNSGLCVYSARILNEQKLRLGLHGGLAPSLHWYIQMNADKAIATRGSGGEFACWFY